MSLAVLIDYAVTMDLSSKQFRSIPHSPKPEDMLEFVMEKAEIHRSSVENLSFRKPQL